MPTLLVYRNRDPVRTFMGLGHYGGRHMTPEGLELALNECGRVCAGARDPREDEHDEGDDASTDARRAATTSERLLRRLLEDGKEELSRRAESGDDDEE